MRKRVLKMIGVLLSCIFLLGIYSNVVSAKSFNFVIPVDMKWTGSYGMTASWYKPEQNLTIQIKLYKDGNAVTSYYYPETNQYDFSEAIFMNGPGTYSFELVYSGNGYLECNNMSPSKTFMFDDILSFGNQNPSMPAGKTVTDLQVYNGDTCSYFFNNASLPEKMTAAGYKVEKYYSFYDDGTKKSESFTSDKSEDMAFHYTYTRIGNATLVEKLTLKHNGTVLDTVTHTFRIKVLCKHNYINAGDTATCTAAGISKQRCTICSDVKTSESPMKGHTFREYEWSQTATQHWQYCYSCRKTYNKGNHELSGGECTVCRYIDGCTWGNAMDTEMDELYHWWPCDTHSDPEECPNHGMLEKELHVADTKLRMSDAECIYNCQKGYVCVGCGEYMGATGEHDWVLDTAASKDATYEADGMEVYRCAYNGKKDNKANVIECSEVKIVVLPQLRHNWNYDQVLNDTATCTADGEQKVACKDAGCTEIMTFFSPSKGHKYGEWKVQVENTCTLDGVHERTCSVCGADEIALFAAHGHKYSTENEWKTNEQQHWMICGVSGCGQIILETKTDHEYGTDEICDICSYVKAGGSAGQESEKESETESETTPEPGVVPDGVTLPAAGTVLTDTIKNYSYTVTSSKAGEATVAFTAPKSTKLKKITIPASVVIDGINYKIDGIAPGAFRKCTKLVSVKMGSNITYIGDKAFSFCTSLKTITIPDSVKSIRKNAFYGCKKLKTVKIGKNVTSIGDKAFSKCSALTKITIPSKVKKIGKEAFYNCKKLKTITIKTTKLTTKGLGSKAFRGTHKAASVKVPKSKLKAYKKLLVKRGIAATAKIRK